MMTLFTSALSVLAGAKAHFSPLQTQPDQSQVSKHYHPGLSQYKLAALGGISPLLAGCCDEKTAGIVIGTSLLAGGATAWATLRRHQHPAMERVMSGIAKAASVLPSWRTEGDIISVLDDALEGRILDSKPAGKIVFDLVYNASHDSNAYNILLEAVNRLNLLFTDGKAAPLTTTDINSDCLHLEEAPVELIDSIFRLYLYLTGGTNFHGTISDKDVTLLLTQISITRRKSELDFENRFRGIERAENPKMKTSKIPIARHWAKMMTENSLPVAEIFRAFLLMNYYIDRFWYYGNIEAFGINRKDIRPELKLLIRKRSCGWIIL